jgi:hypothetical protein
MIFFKYQQEGCLLLINLMAQAAEINQGGEFFSRILHGQTQLCSGTQINMKISQVEVNDTKTHKSQRTRRAVKSNLVTQKAIKSVHMEHEDLLQNAIGGAFSPTP